MDLMEQVKRRGTKIIREVEHLSYEERLRELESLSLEERAIYAQASVFGKLSQVSRLSRNGKSGVSSWCVLHWVSAAHQWQCSPLGRLTSFSIAEWERKGILFFGDLNATPEKCASIVTFPPQVWLLDSYWENEAKRVVSTEVHEISAPPSLTPDDTFLLKGIQSCPKIQVHSANLGCTWSLWRKCRGQAVNSKRAQKRSKLLASSAGGTSEAQPIDLEETSTLYFELAVEEIIDFTGEYSGLEVANITGDDSVVKWEHSEKHPLVSKAADENSPVLPERDNEEVPANDDDCVTEKVSF
ncbi:hypothetical protein BTVI_138028 [Pitangus sulphuratus]|nr:hypothetical protein BTVI_138028 [Pitangus sulphuratus]